jgi:hypothetical protein
MSFKCFTPIWLADLARLGEDIRNPEGWPAPFLEAGGGFFIFIVPKNQIDYLEVTSTAETDERTGACFALSELDRSRGDLSFLLEVCRPPVRCHPNRHPGQRGIPVGSFNRPFVEKIAVLLHKHGIGLKEHNADYLPAEALRPKTQPSPSSVR